MQAINIRQFLASDVIAAFEIESATQAFPWSKQNFLESLDAPYLAWVATEGSNHSDLLPIHTTNKESRVIAYLIALATPDALELVNLAVHHRVQQCGAASALWRQLLSWKNKQPYLSKQRICLEVAHLNQGAIRVYYHWGFRQIGIRKNYYRPRLSGSSMPSMRQGLSTSPSEIQDALILEWQCLASG